MDQSILFPIGLMILTFAATLLYIVLQPRGRESQNARENEPWMNPHDHSERCRFEHNAFSEGIRSRDNLTMITGSIIMSVSGAILALSIKSNFKVISAFVGWCLFAAWLLCMYCTTRRTDDVAYNRLRMLERSLGYSINLHLRPITYDKPWHHFREHFWLFILWILTLFAFVLLLRPF